MLNDAKRLVYIIDGRPSEGYTLDELLAQVNDTIRDLEAAFVSPTGEDVPQNEVADKPVENYTPGDSVAKVLELTEAMGELSIQELTLICAAACLRMSEEITGQKPEIEHIQQSGGVVMSFITEFATASADGEPELRDTIRVYAMLKDHPDFEGKPHAVTPVVAVERVRAADGTRALNDAAQRR
ncbi:MAG: hypothetical protein H6741_31750 [Alphaproteobacteria bacterium]|nr:hypothetical protein [Alphaproteobacteria bacterium]